MRTSKLRDERGMALVMAVFALVVMGALVAGSFFVGRIEQMSGTNTVWSTQSAEAAEAGLSWAMVNMEAAEYEAIPQWTPAAPFELEITTPMVGYAGRVWTDSIRRLNNQLYLIRSTGQKMGTGGTVLSTHRVSALIRLARPTIGVNAAVTVQDPIKFNGNSLEVDGHNSLPVGWTPDECPVGAPVAENTDDVVGIRSSTSTGASGKDLDNIDGYPTDVVADDPTVTSETFQNFLDYTYNTLAAQPDTKTLELDTPYNGVGPVLDGDGECDKASPLNFGEPGRDGGSVAQCYNYFVTVHGTAARTKFAGGSRGQGILLIDGDLELVGGFEWSGLILVRGQMKVTGTGNKITGAILTEGVNIDEAGTIGGNAEIHFSRCAIERAMNGAASPMAVGRGWSQHY